MKNNFFFTQSVFERVKHLFYADIYKRITKNAPPIFTRGGDLISVSPQISGTHEEVLTAFFSHMAKCGYSDFFIDIGANIGLTSCQNGPTFKEVHAFEPNPLCHKILEVNTNCSLRVDKCFIYPFGLGSGDYKSQLIVPKKNWGGAWIDSPDQSYSVEQLLSKEGLNRYSDDDYLKLDVEIKDAKLVLIELFNKLSSKQLKNGVIKIDIEGMEPTVLLAISEVLPSDVNVVIVFESFNQNLDIEGIQQSFGGRATSFVINEHSPYGKGDSIMMKIPFIFSSKNVSYDSLDLDSFNAKSTRDIIFIVN